MFWAWAHRCRVQTATGSAPSPYTLVLEQWQGSGASRMHAPRMGRSTCEKRREEPPLQLFLQQGQTLLLHENWACRRQLRSSSSRCQELALLLEPPLAPAGWPEKKKLFPLYLPLLCPAETWEVKMYSAGHPLNVLILYKEHGVPCISPLQAQDMVNLLPIDLEFPSFHHKEKG